jgi:hypothetical protein
MKHLTRVAIIVLTLAPIAGFCANAGATQDAYYVPGNGSNFGTPTTITVGSSASIGLSATPQRRIWLRPVGR